jgi:hypothetical protein
LAGARTSEPGSQHAPNHRKSMTRGGKGCRP